MTFFRFLKIAKNKLNKLKKVTFIQDDSYSLKKIRGNFTAGFAFSWWSHILISKLNDFINVFHSIEVSFPIPNPLSLTIYILLKLRAPLTQCCLRFESYQIQLYSLCVLLYRQRFLILLCQVQPKYCLPQTHKILFVTWRK